MLARRRYLAGEDERRLGELIAALADPQIKAVFCARGGYGAMRLLQSLDSARITPKALVGFSDIVALHALLGRAGRVSIHGPVLTQLGALSTSTHERLFALLESSRPAQTLHGGATFVAA
ncbi:peptidase U61, LD-carboxypeptidase A, partial [mine drainage metagenome]